jgi:hypothetical protein
LIDWKRLSHRVEEPQSETGTPRSGGPHRGGECARDRGPQLGGSRSRRARPASCRSCR